MIRARARPAFDPEGWLGGARRVESPNRDARPAGETVSLLVIHGISLPPSRFGGDAIARLFTNRLRASAHPAFESLASLRVSAHFLVRRHGELVQFVPCARRAWHAGVSSWRGRDRCNDFSIGIELEGADDLPYASRQYRALARLTRALLARYPITAIVGHSDVAPGRKTDPGPAFEWSRYRRQLGGACAARVAGSGIAASGRRPAAAGAPAAPAIALDTEARLGR